ncbi:MAG TPA: hypothetical protein VKS78_01275 [Roseiarcus sp.]|nr:hypothetical protein [Roseiarcus sp.]
MNFGKQSRLRHRVFFAAIWLGLLLAIALGPTRAFAVPSFARQTGQPCASCHTAFPELTPFGRRFKLGGYSLEGGDSKIPPFAAMLQTTVTEYARKLDAPAGTYAPTSPNGGFGDNNMIDLAQQASLFYGGKIYDNVGALIQTTYTNAFSRAFAIDNSDIRYANTGQIGSLDFIYGVTVNDNPTVQDVWNTTPVWRFPFINSSFALSPGTATMLESFVPGTNAGAGAYVFLHDIVYAEISAYGSLSPRAQTTLGVCCGSSIEGVGGSTIDGLAPYWRLAVEPNWGDNSLEVGTFGMSANVRPGGVIGFGADKVTDIGVDSQYQYIGDVHAVTIRGSYIYERQQLDSTFFNLGASANPNDDLRSLNVSASYIYDHTISVTGGLFRLSGSPDAIAYANNANFSPNSQGYTLDVAYLPFMHGGPSLWPWFNTRLGVAYTWWTRFDGGTSDIDPVQCPGCRAAKDNNTLLLYAWTAF